MKLISLDLQMESKKHFRKQLKKEMSPLAGCAAYQIAIGTQGMYFLIQWNIMYCSELSISPKTNEHAASLWMKNHRPKTWFFGF